MSNSPEVATAGQEHGLLPSLGEEQLAVFWARIVEHLDAGRRTAGKFVSRQSVDDVVHSAAVRYLESFHRPVNPAIFPATAAQFRGEFLKTVQNYAIDCVRDTHVGEHPIHSHWAQAPEPVVGGRNCANRELDRVFARNDHGEYDAPAPTERHPKEDLDELHQILRSHLEDLSPMQTAIVVETFFEKRKRAEVAARHGISVSTYDNHLQAAFRALRASFKGVVEIASGIDMPPWYDVVEDLCDRYDARQQRRMLRKKEKRSSIEGKRGNSEGKRRNLEGERANSGGERANSGGERSNFEGERRNAAREGDERSRAGAA